MVSPDPASIGKKSRKPAGQRRQSLGLRPGCRQGRGRPADRLGLLGRALSRSRATGGEPCCGSLLCPFAEGGRNPPAPRRAMGRANAGPRAARAQCEHHRPAVERTPSVLEAAQSGRQPFTTAAAAGIDDRPSASCHHPVPKSVPPSPALHIRLIRALHKFLQDRGAIVSGAALQASPRPRVPTTLRPHWTPRQPVPESVPQQPRQRHWPHGQLKPLTCENLSTARASSRTGCYGSALQSSRCQLGWA